MLMRGTYCPPRPFLFAMSKYPKNVWWPVRTEPGKAIYRRRLGNMELEFYWDSVFNGTAITINHVEVTAEEELEATLFSDSNVKRSWVRMKQRFPMIGASVEELPELDAVEFMIDEASLHSFRQGEVHQTEVENVEGIERLIRTLRNGPNPLSNEIIFQTWIVKQKEIPHRYHIIFCAMHFIDRKSTRLNSSHSGESRMPSSA